MGATISVNELKNRIRARIDTLSVEDRNNALFDMALKQIEAFETQIIELESLIDLCPEDK